MKRNKRALFMIIAFIAVSASGNILVSSASDEIILDDVEVMTFEPAYVEEELNIEEVTPSEEQIVVEDNTVVYDDNLTPEVFFEIPETNIQEEMQVQDVYVVINDDPSPEIEAALDSPEQLQASYDFDMNISSEVDMITEETQEELQVADVIEYTENPEMIADIEEPAEELQETESLENYEILIEEETDDKSEADVFEFVVNTEEPAAYAVSEPSFDEVIDALFSVDITVTYQQTKARSMLDMINDFRTGGDAWYWDENNTDKVYCENLSKYEYDYVLEEVAMQRAAELALYDDHTRPNGSDFYYVYDEFGYKGSDLKCSENTASGNGASNAEVVFNAFKEENADYSGQGHRRNMLSSKYTSIGVGCVYFNGYYYWAVEFADFSSSSAQTPANDSSTIKSVEIALSFIDYSTLSITPSVDKIDLQTGETADLPTLTIALSLTKTKGSSTPVVDTAYSWEIGDSNLAEISGGKLAAKSAGTTELKTSVFNTEVAIPVSITGESQTTSVKNISDCKLSLSEKTFYYDGTKKKPTVTVKDGSTKLKKGTDYTVSYSNNKNIGTATVTVTGQGNYTGTSSANFKITVETGASYTSGDFIVSITKASINGNGKVKITGLSDPSLTKATIPATLKIGGVKFKVTAIAAKAFKGNTNLKSATIGSNVTKIGNSAFQGCKSMTKVTIKNSVETIDKKAFYNCKKLKTITIQSEVLSSVGSDALKGIKSTAVITVPKSKLSDYRKLLSGKGQESTVTITS